MLSQWSSGNVDGAMKIYAGVGIPENEAMKFGKEIHDIIASKELKLIPEISKDAIFENTRAEDRRKWVNYFRVRVNEWLEMSMVIDVLDRGLIVDWKTGARRSTAQNKMQIYIYAFLLSLINVRIDQAILAKVDTSGDSIYCTDYSIYKINDEKRAQALNYIETNAGEIYTSLDYS